MSDLAITYSFDASPKDLEQLTDVQVDAIWQRHLQDNDADYQDDKRFTQDQIQEFLDRNPDYMIVMAHAALPDNPHDKKLVGYALAAPYADDQTILSIDQFYALQDVTFGRSSHLLKPHNIGPTLLNEMTANVADCVDTIEAYPLHGSERVYRKNGFVKDESNPIFKKYLHD